jgi:[ribosomal protein S5]-alanine N-acetyltransferase
MRGSPAAAAWLLRGVIRRLDQTLLGYINFHGPPDASGRAELGYAIFEEHGYRAMPRRLPDR